MNEQNQPYDSLTEFVKILIKYMEAFGLEAIDIAFLSYTTRVNIENLVNLNGSLELPRMEAIAQSFGLHHYQFSNPDQEIPVLEILPERTLKRIEYRKKSGPYVPDSRTPSTINQKITVALSFFEVGDEFLTEHIVNKINFADADTTANTSLVGDRLTKSFSRNVINTTVTNEEKTGKGRKPKFFKMVSKIDANELEAAVKILGDYWFDNYKKLIDKDSVQPKGEDS